MTYERVAEYTSAGKGNDSFGAQELWNLGKPPSLCPPFKLERNLKCFPEPAHYEFSQKLLCDRIVRAAKLAKKAILKLHSKPISSDTGPTFSKIFGQGPNELWEISGMPRKRATAGAIVAYRFQKVLEALQTRETLYRCGPCHPNGANSESREKTHALDTIVRDPLAWAVLCKDEVWLCQRFWNLKPEEQIGIVIHEMFHLCYGLTCAWFQHDHMERKRNNAYCYEAFALIIDGISPSIDIITKCTNTPV